MTRCSECILFVSQGVPVFPGIEGFVRMPGSSTQPLTSTHDNPHITVVAELNMLFRNKTQDMLFTNKTQDCFK